MKNINNFKQFSVFHRVNLIASFTNKLPFLFLMLFFLRIFGNICFAQTGAVKTDISGETAASNRQVACRYLELARSSLGNGSWQTAWQQASLGIAYDSEIADLWYVEALALKAQGKSFAEVIPLVQQSLQKETWLNYNKNAARILYADILSDTCEWQKAIETLDSYPVLVTADSDYIRIKSLYRMKTGDSVKKARERIAAAVDMFPTDSRFLFLFFRYELNADLSVNALSSLAKQASGDDNKQEENGLNDEAFENLKRQLLQRMRLRSTDVGILQLYASFFETETERDKLLRSYYAAGLNSQLFICAAIKTDIFTQRELFNIFMDANNRTYENTIDINNTGIAGTELNTGYDANLAGIFTELVTDSAVLKDIGLFFETFNGKFSFDTNKDGIYDLSCSYLRGRPLVVEYDKNQDGKLDLTVNCDFGTPVLSILQNENVLFSYDEYPYVSTIATVIPFTQEIDEAGLFFSMIPGRYRWNPIVMTRFSPFDKLNDTRLPPKTVAAAVPADGVLSDVAAEEAAAGSVTPNPEIEKTETGSTIASEINTLNVNTDSNNTLGATDTFSTTDATGIFENNISDNGNMRFYVPRINSNFEKFDKNLAVESAVAIDVATNERSAGKIKFYLQNGRIRSAIYTSNGTPYAQTMFENGIPVFRNVDQVQDGFFEVTEKYGFSDNLKWTVDNDSILYGNLPQEIKLRTDNIKLLSILSDSNDDSIPDFIETYLENGWSCQWDDNGDGFAEIVFFKKGNNETSSFINPVTKKWVSISSENGIPLEVLDGEEVKSVEKDVQYDFYWIGNSGVSSQANKLIDLINQSPVSGVLITAEFDGIAFTAVKIGSKYFGEIIND